MKLPKKIFNVLNEKQNFDFIFIECLKDFDLPEDAYDEAISRIRKFAPKYTHSFKSYNSYRAKAHFNTNGDVEIPQHIVDAVTYNFDDFVDVNVRKYKLRKKAYDMAMWEINKYFPRWKLYKNYQSYKSSYSIKRKKRMDRLNKKLK